MNDITRKQYLEAVADALNQAANEAFEKRAKDMEFDPIHWQRLRPLFIAGFLAAFEPNTGSRPAPVMQREAEGVIGLARLLLPFIQTMGTHLLVTPGDMMTALGIITVTIGRGIVPQKNHREIWEIFMKEMRDSVVDYLDRKSSSDNTQKNAVH